MAEEMKLLKDIQKRIAAYNKIIYTSLDKPQNVARSAEAIADIYDDLAVATHDPFRKVEYMDNSANWRRIAREERERQR